MNKYILSLLVIISFVKAEEVSAFGAGNLDAKNPYGLNTSEKHILKNQKKISRLSTKINDLNFLIDSIKKRLEGLESISEGDSAKLNSTVLKVNKLMKQVDLSSELSSKNSQEAEEIKNVSTELLNMKAKTDKEMRRNIHTLKKALSKVSKLVNKINSEYVSSAELKTNMQQFVTREEFEALKKSLGMKTTKLKSPSKKEAVAKTEVVKINKKLTTKEKSKLLKEAKSDFSKKYFKYAIPKFEKLIEENYKPAESNFYLGEMWYIRKKYDLAISHFKKSAILYDKAAYMPTLLLHSAISFENIDDISNAKNFYSTLVELYPKAKESKIAKKNLSKL